MADDLKEELRLIGCHANGDARCTCNIGQDAIARIKALEAALQAADELAALAEKSRPMTSRAFGAGIEEREGGSSRRQGQLIKQYEEWLRSTDVALTAYRKARGGGA